MQNNRTVEVWNEVWLKKQNHQIDISSLRILDYIEEGVCAKDDDIIGIGY